MTITADCVWKKYYASKNMLNTNYWTKEVNRNLSGDTLKNFSCVIYHFTLTNLLFSSYLVVGWLFGFYGKSTFVGYLMLNPFLYK